MVEGGGEWAIMAPIRGELPKSPSLIGLMMSIISWDMKLKKPLLLIRLICYFSCYHVYVFFLSKGERV